jgi:putative PIN family toxin of toxin-antitoxin system
VVLDTNVLVSALLSKLGNPAKIYQMFLLGTLEVVVSTDMLVEYRDVLHRPRLNIAAVDADEVLAAVRQYGQIIYPVPSTDSMLDEDDRVFYDTAKAAGAYLITGNTKHYPKESFILTPSEFLELW